ncbi:MAG TPA: hypothetical protein VLV78_19465 [Thermoanaerobaculia bacterium]|nr:hypothetical protein [Thermoanaerobaculia bacterium]
MGPTEFVADALIPLVGLVMSFVAVIVIVVIVTRSRQRKMEMQVELQAKLIDKFGSSTELVTFLQSETGRRFVNNVQTGNKSMARDKVAGGVRSGIVFTAMGVGFLALWPITGTRGLAWPGVMLLVLGLAFFASAYATLRFSDNRPADTPALPPSIES